MIVCHCSVVSSGDISAALDSGARTVADVCRRTGAAQRCGTCVFSVRQVVCQHEAAQPELAQPKVGSVRAAS
jgi:bacterioferritin-associated ferredoxin